MESALLHKISNMKSEYSSRLNDMNSCMEYQVTNVNQNVGGIRDKLLSHWTVGHKVERTTLHLQQYLYQNSLH